VRVVDVDPPGLLGTRVYIDLVGKGRDAARAALLEGVRGREAAMPPAEEPAFPGDQAVAAPVAAPERQNLNQLVKHHAVGDPPSVAAQRVMDLAGGEYGRVTSRGVV
jgi:hypothetical protein